MTLFAKLASAATVAALLPLTATAGTPEYQIEQGLKYGELSTVEAIKLRDAGEYNGTSFSFSPNLDTVITDRRAREAARYGDLNTVQVLGFKDRIDVTSPAHDAGLQVTSQDARSFVAGASAVNSPLTRANVVTAENQLLGFVQGVYQKDGAEYAWVKINNQIGVEHDNVIVPVERVNTQGSLVLGQNVDYVRNGLTPVVNSYNLGS